MVFETAKRNPTTFSLNELSYGLTPGRYIALMGWAKSDILCLFDIKFEIIYSQESSFTFSLVMSNFQKHAYILLDLRKVSDETSVDHFFGHDLSKRSCRNTSMDLS